MKYPAPAIMGGDPFCDVFRALYDPHCYWKLTDPDYCISVMRGAYDGGCRAFDYSFPAVQEMFLRLRDSVGEPIVGYGNPTYLQGPMLNGRHLQFLRSRIISTYVKREGFMPDAIRRRVQDELREKTCMVFGFDLEAEPLSDGEIASIYLDEDVYQKRLDGIGESTYVLVGGTDADWLYSLGRGDIIARMAQVVRSRGQIPLLLCHYASTVLREADAQNLDVEGYFAPINQNWAWFDQESARQAVLSAKKPVTAFMAFACGDLRISMRQAAEYLRDCANISGVLFGTTKAVNARSTAAMLGEVFQSPAQ